MNGHLLLATMMLLLYCVANLPFSMAFPDGSKEEDGSSSSQTGDNTKSAHMTAADSGSDQQEKEEIKPNEEEADEKGKKHDGSAGDTAQHAQQQAEPLDMEKGFDGHADDNYADVENLGDDDDADADRAYDELLQGPLDKEHQELLDALLEPLPAPKPKEMKKIVGEEGAEEEEAFELSDDDVPTWQAGKTEYLYYSDEQFQEMLGVDLELERNVVANDTAGTVADEAGKSTTDEAGSRRRRRYARNQQPIPREFDARRKWPQCAKVIGAIRDQSRCGSCWAVAVAATYTDRMCIAMAKAGMPINSQMRYSAVDLLSCMSRGKGCRGGSTYYAWQHIEQAGIVTGGGYVKKIGCQPYPFPLGRATPRHIKEFPTPRCINHCANRRYHKEYDEDKERATQITYWRGNRYRMAAMQREIMTNGPITVTFRTYKDLSTYKGGLYWRDHFCMRQPHSPRCERSSRHGWHAVRLIGWGQDRGYRYWLAVNSWGHRWGENGLFRILRGTNEGEIESAGIVFGTPVIQ